MKKPIYCGIALIIVFSILLVTVLSFPINSDVYIFSEIEECKLLIDKEENDSHKINLLSQDSDKYAETLPVNDYFCAECDSFDRSFEIYAYEFIDSSTAKKYFENVTGKETTRESNYSASSGLFTYELTVICENKAYRIKSNIFDAKEINELLRDFFSIKLDF